MTKLTQAALAASALVLAFAAASPSFAADKKAPAAPQIDWVKSVPLDLAMGAAEQALNECRRNNRHPSVGVMDMDGQMKVLLIDDNAGEVGQHALVHKMYTALLLQQTTEDWVEKSPPGVRSEIDPDADVLDKIAPGGLISPGGYALKVGNEFVGVLGVGGTGLGMKPGSEGECAKFGGDWFEARVNK